MLMLNRQDLYGFIYYTARGTIFRAFEVFNIDYT